MRLLPKLLFAASLFVVLFTPSADSIWIDEAMTASYVGQETLEAFSKKLFQDSNSEAQMPLYLLQAWWSGQLLGQHEWALRAQNIFFGFLGVASMYWIGRRFRMPWLPLLFAVHPYFIYYLNEARPYAMQIGFASLILASLLSIRDIREQKRIPVVLFTCSMIGLCGASMLGALLVAVLYGYLAVALLQRNIKFYRAEWGILLTGTTLLASLGGYYAWTLLRGSGGARIWEVSLKNIAFSMYEFSGFSGLGPPRHELRVLGQEQGLLAVALHISPLAVLLGALLGILFLHWVWRCFRTGEWGGLSAQMLLFVSCTVGLLLVLSVWMEWPFWGRHLAPTFPFFILWLSFALQDWIENQPGSGWGALCALLLLLAFSAGQIRFASNHKRDDYRAAAGVALESLTKGDTVWWAANRQAAEYYKISNFAGIVYFNNPRSQDIPDAVPPGLIVLSKPDVYDNQSILRDWIRDQSYKMTGEAQAFYFYRPRNGEG